MLKDWIEVRFTVHDFTVTELWRNEFTKFILLFSDGSVLDTSPTPPSTRGCDILHETSIEIPRSAVTVASPIGNGKKKTPSTTTVSHSARSCGKIQNQLQEVGQNFRPNRDSGVNLGLNQTNKQFISKSKLIQIRAATASFSQPRTPV